MSESARAGASGAGRGAASSGSTEKRRNIFSRSVLFWRQVIGELKKVVRPSRADLINYATAVLVFVAIVMAFVTVLDLGIGTAVGWIFGG